MTAGAVCGILLVSACGSDPEEEVEPPGAGPERDGVAAAQALAPEPAGDQHSHDQMRTALDSTIEGAEITDTDDWWDSLRDLQRELQKLRVSPTDCKPFVTASALPVPAGALIATADHAPRQTAIYSFEGEEEAHSYVNQELDGTEECEEHTVTRELDDGDVAAQTTLTDVEITSGAEDALALSSVLESEDETQWGLSVMLRYESSVVRAAQDLEEPLSEGEAEALAGELEAEAAAVLSEVTGEDIVVPDPEPEDDDDEDGGEDAGEGDDDVAEDGQDPDEDGQDDADADES